MNGVDGAARRSPKPGIAAPAVARAALIPLSISTCFVLYYVAHVPFWVVALTSLPFLLAFALAPKWAAASTAAFDRDKVALLMTKSHDKLRRRYARAVGMRVFGPPAIAAERRGLIALEGGDAGAARVAYKKAIDGYDDGEPPLSVQLGYAHACFETGEDEEAIRHYRDVLRRAGSLPKVQENLDRAIARSRKQPTAAAS